MTTENEMVEGSNDIPRGLITLLAIACGIAVANIYYNQSLLMLFVQTFHCTNASASLISSSIQVAYAVGLLLFVPLGDKIKSHKLISGLLVVNIIGSTIAATAPVFEVLLIGNILIGLTSVSAQIIIPTASLLAKPASRGKVLGSVMSGLFAGVLLARTISGFVGEYAGWRAMYWLAVALDILLAVIILLYLPRNVETVKIPYSTLLRSMGHMLWNEPVLRVACFTGFLLFAAFSALWGTLAFLLAQPPYQYGSNIVGLFGLAGIIGIISSSTIGSIGDKAGGKQVVVSGAALVALAFAIISQAQFHLWALILGMILLDLGSRAGLIGNQIRIYALAPEARSRMNTIFMSCYFVGGAVGTRLGATAGTYASWLGVAALGSSIAMIVVIAGWMQKRVLSSTMPIDPNNFLTKRVL